MIEFHYETDFIIDDEPKYSDWITRTIGSEGSLLGDLSYIFCDDNYLLGINKDYLSHDTFTDIITFDYTQGKLLGGDIFISVDRVRDNAKMFDVPFKEELLRVMAHGVLHLMGFKDKTDVDVKIMRGKEDEKMRLFHVEQ